MTDTQTLPTLPTEPSTQDLYDEWSKGMQVVPESTANQNEFFQSYDMNLDKPAEFQVPPESLPANPTEQRSESTVENQTPPVNVAPEAPDETPEVMEVEGGGTLTLEKTSKGWHATLDSGEPNIVAENFYGSSLKKLALNMAKAKLSATKAILKLKKEKLLGGDEPTRTVDIPAKPSRPQINVNQLSADDVYAIKQKFAEERPDEAFDLWLSKKYNVKPEEFADALKDAKEAKKIVEAQRVKGEIDEVNTEFVKSNPDWNEEYGNVSSNLRMLVGRMAKAYLNKKITAKTPQPVVDTTIYELFSGGFWTVENLETAKEELIESGLLEKSVSRATPPTVNTPPAAPLVSPSVPDKGIPGKAGQNAGAGFGLPVRGTSAPVEPSNTPPSDVDLYNLPLDQLRKIAQAQLAQQR